MYESEVYLKSVQETLPQGVYDKFLSTYNSIQERSILHWTEHCTECSIPHCFKTCDLYSARIDGKCRRFLHGIELVKQHGLADDIQILKIQFKKWGVLATQGNNELFTKEKVSEREKKDLQVAKLIHLTRPKFVKRKLSQKRYSVKKNNILKEQNQSLNEPHVFLIEIFNPSDEIIFMGLTIRNEDEKYRKIPFQYRIELKPGYNKECIPFDEIIKRVKVDLPYRIDITPENISSDIPLYFGITEFVKFKELESNSKKSKKIKCVVWDLDNTVWNGTLVEDGIENLWLKEGIKEILTHLEQKGIIHSIASKNNIEPALEALNHFGIKDFFLFPKISWFPKSKGIREIALDLNINVNTILFVDDSVFERNEVQTVLPQVKTMDALDYKTILDLEELQVPITTESKKRKHFYLNEVKRKEQSINFEGGYFDFLKKCNIKLEIIALSKEHFDRVYELTQRTNQMNFSGNRYEKSDILDINKDKNLSAYVLKCQDNFGEYGIIGFGIINLSENRLIDLMFSCRIQSKRVEHAFLTYCLRKYLNRGDFFVTYKHTEKNKFSAQVFYDFDFEITKQVQNTRYLKFARNRKIINDQIVTIKY